MTTRPQAQQLLLHYSLTFPVRIDAMLTTSASAGVLGGTIGYANVARAVVDAVLTRYTAAGWTVTDDTVNSVLTFA